MDAVQGPYYLFDTFTNLFILLAKAPKFILNDRKLDLYNTVNVMPQYYMI